MDTNPVRVVIFGMKYLIALDIQRAIAENFGWDARILSSPWTWPDALATADFDLMVTTLSPIPEENLERVQNMQQQRRGIVFATTLAIRPEQSGAKGWPIVDLPFTEDALVEAINSAIGRLRLAS